MDELGLGYYRDNTASGNAAWAAAQAQNEEIDIDDDDDDDDGVENMQVPAAVFGAALDAKEKQALGLDKELEDVEDQRSCAKLKRWKLIFLANNRNRVECSRFNRSLQSWLQLQRCLNRYLQIYYCTTLLNQPGHVSLLSSHLRG